MAGGHGGVRGENALPPHRLDVLRADQLAVVLARAFIEQFDRQQAGVAFVHVEAGEVIVAEGAQHPHPADAQDGLLAKAIPGVAAIEMIGQFPVPLAVVGQVAIQQIDGDGGSGDAFNFVFPGADLNRAAFQFHRDALGQLFEEILDDPLGGFFGLPAGGVEALVEIAFAVEEGDGDHRHLQIRR